MRNERIRAIAQAVKDGTARAADLSELAQWVLDEQEERPLTDAELQALSGFAAIEECQAQRANNIRLLQHQAAAYDEDWEGAATTLLRAELKRRGVLP